MRIEIREISTSKIFRGNPRPRFSLLLLNSNVFDLVCGPYKPVSSSVTAKEKRESMVILAAATATVHRSSAAAVAAAWAPSSSTSLLTESLCTPLLARRRRASILQQATSSRARAPAARCQSCRGIYTGGSAVAVTSQARSLKDSGRSQSRPVSRTTAGSQRYFSSWSDRRGALHAGILQPGQSSRSLSTNTGGGQAPGKKGKGNKGKGRATNGPSTQPRRDLPRRDWNAVPRNANQSSIPVASPSASSSSSPKPAVSTAAVKEDRSPAGRRSASRKQQQQIFLPAVISVSNLARLLGVKMRECMCCTSALALDPD